MTTSATVTQYFNNVLQRDPSASELSSWVALIDSGALTSAQALEAIVNSSEAQTYAAQVIRFYQAAFGRLPDAAGINGWVDQLVAGTTTTTELAVGFVLSAEWTARYGGTEVNAATLTGLYQNVLGRSPSGAEIDAWIATGQSLDQVFIGFANSAEFQNNASTAVNALLTTAGNTATADIATIYDPTKSLDVDTNNGSTFTLTSGVDNVTGTANNDTINATPGDNGSGVANVETLNAFDTIDGGAGTDTLNDFLVGATSTAAATVTNVENYVVNGDGAITSDVQGWTGLQNVTVAASTGALDIDTKSNVTNVTTKGDSGADNVHVQDNGAAGTDTLATVKVEDTTGTVTVVSDVLTSLTLDNTGTGAALVTAAAGTRDLMLTVDGVGTQTVTDATATGLTIKSSGNATTALTTVAAAATAVTIDADETLGIAALTTNVAKTVTVTGDSVATVTAATVGALTTIDTSGATGGLTWTPALGTGVTYTGGAGKDTIASMGATTKANTLGGGDDSVTLTVAALGTGGSIDAGDGTDTLGLTAANAATASAGTTFEGTVSNFEKVSIGAVAADAGVTTVDMANLDDINHIISAGLTGNDGGDSLVLNNVTTGGTFELIGDNTAGEDGTTINVSGAAVNASDTFTVHLNTGTTAGVIVGDDITIADVETVNISTQDGETSTTAVAASIHTATLVATSATTVNVSGNNGLNLTNTGNTKIETFDASGIAADTAADTAANLAVTFVSDNVTTAVSITGGAGDDTLTADAASTKVNTISGGAGDDNITGGAGADVLTGGAGADTLTGNLGQDTFTGGDGNDNFVIGVTASGVLYDTITDATAGDTITLAAGLGNAFNQTAVTAGANAVFQDFLDIAASTADTASWFQFNGNTYVVGSANAVGGFTNGVDTVVEITGAVDLSNSTILNDVLTIV